MFVRLLAEAQRRPESIDQRLHLATVRAVSVQGMSKGFKPGFHLRLHHLLNPKLLESLTLFAPSDPCDDV